MDKSYSVSHKKYYETNKEEINARRREYAREHQREYHSRLRAIKMENGTYRGRGRPRKVSV